MLIQKDTKQASIQCRKKVSLRALLIQKDTKLGEEHDSVQMGLRALLIQKDTKLFNCRLNDRGV